jgi:TolB-like protein
LAPAGQNEKTMSLFAELKRRNVIKATILYVVASWLLLQVTDVLIPALTLPESALRLVALLLILGFPLVVIFSWVYEMTPDGLKREEDVDRSATITRGTGRRINVLIVVLLVLAIVTVVIDRLIPETASVEKQATVADQTETLATDKLARVEPTTPGRPIPERSIAVLPFVNMSGDKENEYFADGLSEEILNTLVGIDDLQVTARTSSFQFKGKNEDLRDVGAMLGVANVLEGSVRRSGDRARITAQLIRAEDGYHLWSQTYDRTLEDTFKVQTDIAESVARALDVVLDDDQRQRMRDTGVRDVDAFVDYQKGRAAFFKAHEDGIDLEKMRESADYFTKAVVREPGLARAYYLRSDYQAHSIMASEISDARRAEFYAAYQNDIAMASRHAGNPAQRAAIEVDATLISTDWSLLDARFEQALDSAECPDTVWLEIVQAIGNRQKALEFYERAIACDPLNWYAHQSASAAALWAGQPELALEIARAGQRLLIDADLAQGASNVDLSEIFALLALDRGEEARHIAEQSLSPLRLTLLTVVAAAQLRLNDARAFREEELAGAVDGITAFNKLTLYAITGDRQTANTVAAELDRFPAGPMILAAIVRYCTCGAPFDLEATPNFKARLEEAGIPWPPFTAVEFPAMQSQ